MRQAAERVRAGGDAGDEPGAREAMARLLEHLAGQNLDVHTFDRAAGLADRILARSAHESMSDGRPLPSGYNNGQPRTHTDWPVAD